MSPMHPTCVNILVIGDRFASSIEDLSESFRSATSLPFVVKFCSDRDFFLSRLHFYAEHQMIIVNWSKQAALLALFLQQYPQFSPKVVLVSGILKDSKNPTPEQIMGYGMFDYFISTSHPGWGGHSWQLVFDELTSVPAKRKKLSFGCSIGFYEYRWRDHKFRYRLPSNHFEIIMANSGMKDWTENPGTRFQAFDGLPTDFRLEMLDMNGEIEVRPVWGKPAFAPGTHEKCFVLMPFKHPFTEIYDDFIKPTVETMGFSCLKADDFFTTNSVVADIWNGIYNCFFLIAELTGRNSNVMYELGIAHTLGKDVILICQESEDIPFDFRHMRYYRYDFTPRGCEQLRENLMKAIAEIKQKP
jgi:hypothetical protein